MACIILILSLDSLHNKLHTNLSPPLSLYLYIYIYIYIYRQIDRYIYRQIDRYRQIMYLLICMYVCMYTCCRSCQLLVFQSCEDQFDKQIRFRKLLRTSACSHCLKCFFYHPIVIFIYMVVQHKCGLGVAVFIVEHTKPLPSAALW